MKEKILNLLNQNSTSVNQAAFFLAFFALLAQFLGLIRDRLLASQIGPSTTLDIYYAAFKIPDLIFVLVASLASVVVLLPILAEKIKNYDETKKFFNQVFSFFGAILILVSVVIFFIMPQLIEIVVPGFSIQAKESTTLMSRLMLLSPIFLGFSTIFGAITQLFKKFFLFSLLPVFYNLGILIGVICFYPIFGLPGLAYGVILGAFLHFVLQVPVVAKLHFFPSLTFRIDWQTIKKVILISLPRTAGLGLSSLVMIFLLALASKMAPGAISLFTFAIHLQAVPLNLIGVSYSMAAFPTLSLLINEKDKFIAELTLAARQIIFWSLPVMILFIVLRAQIVRVIFGAGLFDWNATRLTAAAVALFSISIFAQCLILLFTRAFYASQKTWRPFVINFLSSLFIVGLALFFLEIFRSDSVKLFIESILRVKGVAGTTLLALPLAFSMGSILNAFLLWLFLKKDFSLLGFDLTRTWWQSGLAAVILGFVTYFFLNVFAGIFDLNTFYGIFLQGFLAGILGILAGFFVLHWLGSEEYKIVVKAVKTRFTKPKKIVISEEAS